jgi:hypothetical protein
MNDSGGNALFVQLGEKLLAVWIADAPSHKEEEGEVLSRIAKGTTNSLWMRFAKESALDLAADVLIARPAGMVFRGMFLVAVRDDHVVAVLRTDGGSLALRFADDGSVAPVEVEIGELQPLESERDQYERECGRGSPRACTELAYLVAKSPEADVARVAELLRGACDADVDDACYALGWRTADGKGVDANAAAARALFARACKLGDERGCARRGRDAYLAGEFGSAKTWLSLAIEKNERSFYHRIWLALATMAGGDIAGARAGLGKHIASADEKATWPRDLARMVAGQVSAAELEAGLAPLADKQRNERLCELAYFSGELRLIAGDAGAARRAFEKAVATNVTTYIEYDAAKRRLASSR